MITAINKSLYAKRDELEKDEKGFTLVELLVVVIIIGILAAIAIPVFLNQRESAWRGSVESDIKNAQIAAETYAANNGGDYDGLDAAALTANGYQATEGVTLTVAETDTAYTIAGSHAQVNSNAAIRWYDSDTGVISDTAP